MGCILGMFKGYLGGPGEVVSDLGVVLGEALRGIVGVGI